MGITERLLNKAPSMVKDAAVTVASSRLHIVRRIGRFKMYLHEYQANQSRSKKELEHIQLNRLRELLVRAKAESSYYQRLYSSVADPLKDFQHLPFLKKADLQDRLDDIVAGQRRGLWPVYTGGTTGKAITVYYELEMIRRRAAAIAAFWDLHGFRLGKQRVAWFSGRPLVFDRDVVKRCFWRTNWLYRIRYYSTFHMSRANLRAYVANLNEFKPEYMSGFPSAIAEVARYAEAESLSINFQPRAVFVTSETLTTEQRSTIERVFRTCVRNQYGSSEGAPLIMECRFGRLHLDITTGVFELFKDGAPDGVEGELVVTSFIAWPTPIIRYAIGDRLRMSRNADCPCGWKTPLAEAIDGRMADFIDVPGRGRIFNAQIGDCVKGASTVIKFQVELGDQALRVYLVANRSEFERKDKASFMGKLRERVGDLPIEILYLDDIPRAKSGKHTLIRATR